MATIGQPYHGRWDVSDHGVRIGMVNGDFAVGFVARDQDDHLLGHFPTYERAMFAVLNPQRTDGRARRYAMSSVD
jgi:hypothetical protein